MKSNSTSPKTYKKKPITSCPICGGYVERRSRSVLFKLIFPSVKKYFCFKCMKNRFVKDTYYIEPDEVNTCN